MRIRTLKPEFWTNEKLCELSESTHILAAALLNYADDEGYFNANPKLVKAALFPLRDPSRSVPVMMQELSQIGYLKLGKCMDGRDYGFIVNFAEHQVVNKPKPSKIKCLEISWTSTGQVPDEYRWEQGTGNREQGTGNREQRARARATNVDEDFETFWKYYPKKVGKRDALKAFQKARKSGLPEIGVLIRAIEQQRKSDQWRRDSGQYIPNPSTWLNQGRWDDVLPEGPGRKLLPQELAQREIQEWLEEEESKDGTEDDCFLFAGSGRIVSGEVVTDEADELCLGEDAERH